MNIYIGRWLNVPVTLHWTWMAFLFFIMLTQPSHMLMFVLTFLIVLLHELGHCFAAQYFGRTAQSITLFPIGGVAMIGFSEKPKEELVVALAGPAVNVILIPILFLLSSINSIFMVVQMVNIIMLIFNMLPAFPMDGGRVLRSILSMITRDHAKATVIAGRIGQLFALFMISLAIVLVKPMFGIIGIFIFITAYAEMQSVKKEKIQINTLGVEKQPILTEQRE